MQIKKRCKKCGGGRGKKDKQQRLQDIFSLFPCPKFTGLGAGDFHMEEWTVAGRLVRDLA